jgi:hypothetical protein
MTMPQSIKNSVAIYLPPVSEHSICHVVVDLPSRTINKEVFENELAFAVLKRPTTVRALNLTVGRRRISFDTNQLVLRTTIWTFE